MYKPILVLSLLLILAAATFAEDYVAVNSLDGRDVLSGVFYANAKGLPVKFMPTQGSDSDLFASKVGTNHSILLIQSSDLPVSGFVESALKGKGNALEIYSTTDGALTNLELAKRSGAQSFIIVDSAFSDSALSVLPYAKLTKSYVILADKSNSDQVKGIVSGKKVIIFGYVDKEVSAALSQMNPEVIGKGGDKFDDNILIVDKAMNEFNLSGIIIADGTSLEEGMAGGEQPILLVGKIVPQVTYDFVKGKVASGRLTSVMLIGNTLVNPVYDMRKRIEADFASTGQSKTFGIVVKFAQVVPSAGTGVISLDTFSLPAYIPKVDVGDIVYNTQTKTAMVTVSNNGEGPAYYNIEVRVKVDGADYKSFPPNGTSLIQRGEQLGTQYPVDLSQVTSGNVTALVLVKFGSSIKSLEEFAIKEGPLTSINYVDKSNVTVQFAKYDASNKNVLVTVRNNGKDPAYVFTKLNLILQGAPSVISAPATRTIDPGALYIEEFPLDLSEKDLAANNNVTVTVDYGGRQGFLLKHDQYVLPLEKESNMFLLIGGVLLALVLIVAVAAYFFLKGRKKEKEEPKVQAKAKK